MERTGQKPIEIKDLEEGDLLYHKKAYLGEDKFGLFDSKMSTKHYCFSKRIFNNFDTLHSSLDGREFSETIKLLAKRKLTSW